jgi:hypothetical protein
LKIEVFSAKTLKEVQEICDGRLPRRLALTYPDGEHSRVKSTSKNVEARASANANGD